MATTASQLSAEVTGSIRRARSVGRVRLVERGLSRAAEATGQSSPPRRHSA